MPNQFLFRAQFFFKIFIAVFLFMGASLFSMPAKAGFQPIGFQWVAPAEQAPAPSYAPSSSSWNSAPMGSPPPLMPAPAAPVTAAPPSSTMALAGENPQIISPIVIEGAPLAPPATSTPSVPGTGQTSSLGMLSGSSDATVQGFANNVPLAVALREILPAGYGFSIDQDVDLGTLVSFQGGKPWRETLQTTLQQAGLSMREQNEMVAIGHAQSNGSVMPPPSSGMANNAVPNYAPPPEAVASASPAYASPSYTPPPYVAPYVPPSSGSSWPGATANGPKPIIAQPNVSLPAPPPAPPPVSSSRMSSTSIVDTWTASRGDTLHKVLEDWSHRAGAEFEWSAEYDYPLQASISFTGTYEEAVRDLLSGFEEAHPQPVAELHANPGAGQMVLVIQSRGNSYTE